jgi:hypothetical protein
MSGIWTSVWIAYEIDYFEELVIMRFVEQKLKMSVK